MDQRLSFITLAVRDVAASRAFYLDGLGWTAELEADGIVMLLVGEHLMLSLWDEDQFEDEVGPIGRGTPGSVAPFTLSHNVATTDEVDDVLAVAERAGAQVRAAEQREWGGYSGYFADPDGYMWEVAMNPGPTGAAVLPD